MLKSAIAALIPLVAFNFYAPAHHSPPEEHGPVYRHKEAFPKKVSVHRSVVPQQKHVETVPVVQYAQFIRSCNSDVSISEAITISSDILMYSEQYNVDPKWILAIMWQESTFKSGIVSVDGAIGLMQLLPSNAPAADLFDPSQNIYEGVKYYAYLIGSFSSSYYLATVAYNQGITNVENGNYIDSYYYLIRNKYEEIECAFQKH